MRGLKRLWWVVALALLVGGVGAAVMLLPHRASVRADTAAVNFDLYLRRVDGRQADPVNVIFIGETDATAIGLHLFAVMRWAPVRGSAMAFTDRGATRWTEIQVGAPLGGGMRQHMRIASGEAPSDAWGPYALAAVHRDVPVHCGHRGTDFDAMRDAVAMAMAEAGYQVTRHFLGNDGPVEHCDGSVTHGDGWAVVIDLRRGGTRSGAPSPTPTASPATTPSPTPSPSPPPTATPTPTATATPAPTPTPSPAPPPTPAGAPTPMPAGAVMPTATPTRTPVPAREPPLHY